MAVKLSVLVFVILVACFVDNIDGRRISFGSRSRPSTSHSSRPSSSRPSHTSSSGGNHGIPSNGRVSYPRQPSSPSYPSAPSHPVPPIHPSSGTSINRNPASSSHVSTGGAASTQHNKDASTSMINAEGGGATRPSHAPSAPLQPGPGNRGVVTDSRQQSSSHAPSAPWETVSKTSAPTQTQGQPTSGTSWGNPHYNPSQPGQPTTGTSWGNPHYNPNQPGTIGSHNPPPPGFNINSGSHNPPPIGFNVNTNQRLPTASHPTGAQFPPSHTNYPNSPYPPYSPHPVGQPGHMSGSGQPHYPSYPAHGSYPGSPIGNPSYPAPPPIGNPYQTYHPGGYGGAYPQQPQVLAQPASQPFIPGQTVIMMPGQQDSGRGFGQMVKEALVFSTINAGVNRLINPHHHYISDSRPATADQTGTTTHITYNNQYFNTLPNGTVVQVPAPPDAIGVGAPSTLYPTGSYNPGYTNAGVAGSTGSVLPSSSAIPPPNVSDFQSRNPGVTAGGNHNGRTVGTNINASASNQGTSTNNIMNMPQYKISDEALWKISEELFKKEEFDVSKSVILNLQRKSASVNATDVAMERLFYVQSDVYEQPTIRAIRLLYDDYEQEAGVKENVTIAKRKKQNYFLDLILNTNVMAAAMQWLADNGFIDPDDFERKDVLRHVWFKQYDGSTSGFERTFVSEIYGNTSILGVQDWIYFNYLEPLGKINYLGYVDKLDLGDKASLVKLNFEMNGIVRPNATIFVGTTPELEMSLYTICFYARPNNLCPVSLGGAKINIFTHSFRYFGRDLIDLGMPMF